MAVDDGVRLMTVDSDCCGTAGVKLLTIDCD